ncbi:MAG: hypothetical protein MUF83_13815 [Acidimicrobiales bacterium]|jgi:hypothetical protein|nr:hypothetical protein [Acidimicrobiales bacterium]
MACTAHLDRIDTGTCRACGRECCDECLVFSYGRLRPPYCLRCALVASGVCTPGEADRLRVLAD